MSEKIIQLNEEVIKGQLKELVRGSVEEMLNGLLEAEAEKLTQAGRYERSEQRQGYRSGHYNRNLMTTAGEVMSRIGRNYLETGFYTEVVFRKHNVRFIAIANGVDNDHPETGEFVPFLNIMNEWYLKDQSKKVTAAYQLRGKSGLPTNNNCLYGYRKDPDIKHHWLVDEEAAAIVRRIYQMACEGHGPSEIARILTKEKVDNPGYYYTKHACGMRSDYTKEAHAHDWNSLTISRILIHQEYLGHTVNFRSGKRYYKDKRRTNPPEKLLIFENTHEPIVTKETWELAQCALKSIKRTDTLGVANPLTGLVY